MNTCIKTNTLLTFVKICLSSNDKIQLNNAEKIINSIEQRREEKIQRRKSNHDAIKSARMSHGMRRNGNKPTIIDHRVPANQKAGSDRYGITGMKCD
jgi:hypothetical protein